MDLLILFSTLIFNILLYYDFVCILPDRVDIVSRSPEVSSPQKLFDFGVLLEQFSPSDAFDNLHNLFW